MKITRRQLRRLILQEVRIKPEPASSMIPAEHLDKVHDLINAGELASAQSFVDAFGGDPDYVYNYRENERVGDIEKLGAKIQNAASGYRYGALKSDEDRRAIMDSEVEIDRRAEEIAQRHLGDYRSLDDIGDQDEYTKMFDAIMTQRRRANR